MTVAGTSTSPRPRPRVRARRRLPWLLAGIALLLVWCLPATPTPRPGTHAATIVTVADATRAPRAAPTPGPGPNPVAPTPPGPTTTPTPSPSPGPTTATPSPTPDPAPGPSPSPPATSAGGGSGDSGGGVGWFDITGRVKTAIDSWLAGLVTSALNPVLDLMGRTVLATPDVTGTPRVRQLWQGSLVPADTLFVLLVLAGGVLVMTHETLQVRYSIREIAPRIAVGAVAANASLELAGKGIEFANALTLAVVGPGLDPTAAAQRMTQLLVGSVRDGGSFLALMGLVTVVLALVLLVTYLARVALTVLLVAAAPLMLACHALPATEAIAQLWWKAMAACLGVQVGQGMAFLVALRLFFTPAGLDLLGMPTDSGGVVNLLVAVCLFYLLARIPAWVSRMVFTSHRRSTVAGVVRSVVIVKTLGAVGLLGHRRP
jgi:hypothetical protein